MRKIVIPILILSISCNNFKTKSNAPLSMTVKSTSCMGPCPVYEITFKEHQIVLHAKKNLDIEGQFCLKTQDEVWSKIRSMIVNDAISAAQDSYKKKFVNDLPTHTFHFQTPEKSKKIVVTGAFPDFLEDYLKFTEKFIEESDWKKCR